MRNWRYKNTQYLNFWLRFNPKDFFLANLIETYAGNMSFVVESVYPGLLKVGISKIRRRIFGARKHEGQSLPDSPKIIWWTGENVRPPFQDRYDLFVSFDQDNLSKKNLYFPLFYSELLFPNQDSFFRLGAKLPEAAELTRPRVRTPGNSFVCAFINNPEPTRLRAVEYLAKYGQVEVFGKISNTPNTRKIPNGRGFKFVLCFENDLFPGYVTEKLLDAYLCGAVPLYWGDLGDEPHINRKAFINAQDFSSLEEFARYVGNLSDEEYRKIHSEPLLNSLPNADELIEAIKNLKP